MMIKFNPHLKALFWRSSVYPFSVLAIEDRGVYVRLARIGLFYSVLFKAFPEVNIQIVGGVMELPPMEDFIAGKRYEIDVGFNAIKAYLPTNEMLACSKIFSTRQKDLHDLKYEGLLDSCDPSMLLGMVHEYKRYMLSPNDPNSNVHEIIEILNKRVYKWYLSVYNNIKKLNIVNERRRFV